MFKRFSFLSFCAVAALSSTAAFAQTAGAPPPPTGQAYQSFDSILQEVVSPQGERVPVKGQPGMELPQQSSLPQVEPEEIPLSEEAFDAALTGSMPLSTDQIREFLRKYDDTQNAIQTPIYTAPEPKIIIETVSLDPGVKPIEIKTAVGFVTTLNFIDVTGERWPVQDIGWAGEYEILQPEDSSNVIRVTPLSDFGGGNISVRLVDLKTPVILTFKTDREEVHYRADLRIPDLGPEALPPLVATPISTVAGSKDMTAILTGVIPQAAERLVVSGVDSRTSAYALDGSTYVRTPHALLSPGWSASVKSSDGTTVYQTGEAPVLLLSENGRIIRAYLKKKEAVDGL
ncbi:MAG: type IV secretion protein DotH [Alphaproteobacteria bacterium]|nr:type IV secretion protein DotH [Alphaproteobacteria bacterium]